jgi:hypothetical protein
MSAVQELTSSQYQARVVGLLEAIGKAMPGVGFLLGGVIAQLLNPRASFLTAGLGVVTILALSVPLLRGGKWGTAEVSALEEAPEAANLTSI